MKKPRPSSDGPVSASTACSGCGMMPTTLPASFVIAAMSRCEPFGLPRDVAGDHPALGLELVEGALVGHEAALAVLHRDQDLLALGELVRPRGRRRLDAQELVAVAEVQVLVAGERAGQQVGLAEDLEAVADAEHRQAAPGRVGDRLHHRGEPGDGAAAQRVAVREAAGQDHGVDAVQVRVAVPEPDDVGAGDARGAGRVPVVQRAREGDHTDPHGHASSATARPRGHFDQVDGEVLDHRVGEQLVGDLAGGVEVRLAGELDLDAPADAYGGDVGDAEPRQRVRDRLALRIQDLRLEHDVDDDASHGHS